MPKENVMDKFTWVPGRGTENRHRDIFNQNVVYTDGVKFLADTAAAHWLIGEIALAQRYSPKVQAEERIEYTDFPLDEIKLYFENGVICLPSER